MHGLLARHCGDRIARTGIRRYAGLLPALLALALHAAPLRTQAAEASAAPPYSTLAAADEGFSTSRANLGILFGTTAAVALYGTTQWWQDGLSRRFRTEKEGWFGRNTYSGGADKLGHFYITYAGTRLFSKAFEWAGNAPAAADGLAALLMIGTFTGVEILDGFSREFHFSPEDALINVAGAGLGLLMERRPELDRAIDFRIHYWPSDAGRFDPFGDYSGQTYLLVFKGEGLPSWRNHSVLRYLEFAVGYGTRGYSRNRDGSGARGERNLYVGISLNLSRLLDDKAFASGELDPRAQAYTRTALEYIQVPGTAVHAKHTLD